MGKKKRKGPNAECAERLVNLLGEGPEGDEDRYEQARILLMAWSSAQGSVFGMLTELSAIRDNPDYAVTRFDYQRN